jgi:hypothetical protein
VTNPEERFVYLVIDTAMGDTAIRYGILEALADLGFNYSMYNRKTNSHINWMIPNPLSVTLPPALHWTVHI